MEHWYDLNTGMLRIETADPALLAPLLIYLDELRAQPSGRGSSFHLTLERTDEIVAPQDGELLFEGPLPEAPLSRLWTVPGGRHLIIPDRLGLRISHENRSGRMSVTPGNEMFTGGSAGLVAIDAALYACGQHLVHAAALQLPSQEAALTLWAPSGAGKTTASLALAIQGFGLMTDDATVLASEAGPARVWGLPRPLKVHQRTAELLPSIGKLLGTVWNSEGEQSLTRDRLKGTLELPAPKALPVSAMIVVGPRVDGPHILRPLPKTEVLVKLADNNIGRAIHGVQTDGVHRYRTLAKAVASTPAFELNVGKELVSLGEAVLRVL